MVSESVGVRARKGDVVWKEDCGEIQPDPAAAGSADAVNLALLALALSRCLPGQHAPPHSHRPTRRRFPCAKLP